jgi:trimeric autotransporter adhesin
MRASPSFCLNRRPTRLGVGTPEAAALGRPWSRRVRAAVAVACLAASAACSSSSTTVTSPSSVRCPVNLSLTPASVDAAGGSGQVTISVNRECTWEARSESDWITLGAPTSGQGEATLRYTAAANALVTTRRGAVVVNDQRAEIAQSAAACRFDLSAPGGSTAAEGGSLTVSVNAQTTCVWTAVSQVDWVRVDAGRDGSGQGVVALSVDRNAGAARQGMVQIAGQAYSVSQAAAGSPQPQPGPGCTLSVTPSSEQFQNNGGEGTLRITASAPSCAWTAVSSVPWISVSAGSGSGSSTARYVVAPNPGTARTGAVVVGTTAVTVTQAAAPVAPGCEFTVSPQSESVGAGGGDGTIRVTASASSCAWTAVSNVAWITVSSGGGNGNGSVRFVVAANSGGARSGTLTVARATVTVTQAATAACEFDVSPRSASFEARGGEESIRVEPSGSNCAWTAVSQAPWITLSTGGGSGSGRVRYAVASNPGPARTGTMTIANATVTVTQAAAPACAFNVSPGSESFPTVGGEGTVRIETESSCAWTAESTASWITVLNRGGSGNGSVRYVVTPNAGGARTAPLIVAGATVAVSQAALPVPGPISLRGDVSGLSGECPNLTFTVDGRLVRTSGATSFDRCDRLRNGREVRVDGLLQVDGSVLALRVREGDDD